MSGGWRGWIVRLIGSIMQNDTVTMHSERLMTLERRLNNFLAMQLETREPHLREAYGEQVAKMRREIEAEYRRIGL